MSGLRLKAWSRRARQGAVSAGSREEPRFFKSKVAWAARTIFRLPLPSAIAFRASGHAEDTYGKPVHPPLPVPKSQINQLGAEHRHR